MLRIRCRNIPSNAKKYLNSHLSYAKKDGWKDIDKIYDTCSWLILKIDDINSTDV
jgi:hypothetical protein